MKMKSRTLKGLLFAMAFCTALAVGVACGGDEKSSKVKLKFDVDGGVAITDVTAEKGEEITLPTPTKEGYKFEGWYLNDKFEGAPVTSIVAKSNVTYYAKWSQLCVITLDVNGGSLSTTTVYAETGANVYDAVKGYVPTKAGLTFGAWFNGDKELNKNTKITAAGLTLVAQYKVEYTVEIFVQGIDNDEYTKSEELSYTSSDYVGQSISVEPEMDGFMQVEMDDEVLSGTLSETVANNVFKAYFDRNVYRVVFNPNTPGDSNGAKYEFEARYGAEVAIPEDINYFIEGYCMLGWSTGAGSKEIAYQTNLDAYLYNVADKAEIVTQTITVERPTMLYGVWQAGAKDMFGGNDAIFALEEGSKVIYLSRGGYFFKGEYNAKNNTFNFYDYREDEDGILILSGKLFDNGTFLYHNSDRQVTAILYKYAEGAIDENVKIRLDALNECEYTVYDGANGLIKEQSTGTYEMVSVAEYCLTFTEGPKAGQTITVTVGQLSVMNNETGETMTMDGFQIRNDEEYNLGKLTFSGVTGNGMGGLVLTYTEMVYVELNGYGVATYVSGDQEALFKYVKDEDGYYRFYDGNNKDAGVIRLTKDMNLAGNNGYFLYTESLNQTFNLENGGTLTLDGLCNAVYEKDGKRVTSYYVSQAMLMGGQLVTMVDGSDWASFLITFAETDGVVSYTARKVPATYSEYYYKDSANAHYAPLLVLDETEVGKASVYGYTANQTFEKVLEGTYTDAGDGFYLFECTARYDANVYNTPVDFANVHSFIFGVNDKLIGYNVHFWLTLNDVDNCEYFEEEGGDGGSLMLVAGFAFYKQKATMKAIVGVYTVGLGYVSFQDASGHVYFFNVKDATKTFIKLDYMPQMPYLLQSDNIINHNEYMFLDGMGGAVYYYHETKEEGDETPAQLIAEQATVTETGETTIFGSVIYTLNSESGITFDFIMIVLGENVYFLRQEPLYAAGTYIDINNPTTISLEIDGYSYQAIYKNGSEVVEGNYYVTEDGAIHFLKGSLSVNFDYVSEGQVTSRGQEENVYVFFENGDFKGIYFAMDGYGNLSVFTLARGEEGYERVYITEEGFYEMDGDYFTLMYTDAKGNPVVYSFENKGKTYYAIDGLPYIVLMLAQDLDREVLIDTTNWAVLILDNYGNAVKYNKVGQKEKGSYTIVTDKLLYFINNDNTDACIYDYDMDTGAAFPIELKAKTYYTTDLQSLVFSQYGFAIFNGDQENTIFYKYNDQGEAIIYRRAVEGEDLGGKVVSEYGFVEENLGKLEDKLVYAGAEYYKSTGADIKFTRVGNLENYPIKLALEEGQRVITLNSVQFAPGGGIEFTVSGVADVTITDYDAEGNVLQGASQRVNCNVGRDLDSEGNARLYVLIESYFRVYIDADYSGDNSKEANNTFEAVGLQYYQYLYSIMYLSDFYNTYLRYGATRAYALENEYGSLSLNCDLDAEGNEVRYYVSGEFGSKSEFYDTNGEKLTTIDEAQWLSIGSISFVSFTMSDGLEYRLYFGQSQNPYLGIVGYYVYAFVRVQKFDIDGYTLEVGKALYTDIMGVAIDDVFYMSVTNEETELDTDDKYVIDTTRKSLYKIDNVWYCADREYFEDPEYALEATYYIVTLEEEVGGVVEEDGKKSYPLYKSATLQISEAKILRDTSVLRYVEIIEVEDEEGNKESRIGLLCLDRTIYIAQQCTYDEETKTYTILTEESRTFKITVINESTVKIEEIWH